MKTLLVILVLPALAFAGGPKSTFPQPRGLDAEINNIYHDIANPSIGTGTASTMTVTYLAISSGNVVGTLTVNNLNVNGTVGGSTTLGKIKQVVSATSTTPFSTTSATYQTTNLSASITPTSSSSKILVLISAEFYVGQNTASGRSSIFRGSTNLGDSVEGFKRVYHSTSGDMTGSGDMSILDSPATTSATTYSAKITCGGGNTCTYGLNNSEQSIVLVEVL